MQCPTDSPAGAFTKHPNSQDCGKFYLCISGISRVPGPDLHRGARVPLR